MELADFHVDLKQDVAARIESTGDFTESAFAEIVTEFLIDSGTLTEFIPCTFRQRGMKVDGYAFVPDEATLDLFVVDYEGASEPGTLARRDLEQAFKRAETFFEKSLSRKFVDELEVSTPAYALARQILDEASSISRVRFYLLTDSVLSERVKDLPSEQHDGREWSYRVWDLDRLEKVMATGTPEEIVVDFRELFGMGLRCLPAGLDNNSLQCYLAVIPGHWLAEIYGKWSGRLLEQNVRTFLQLKGSINKKIRETILTEPENFFPYNNGISTTAESAEIDDMGDTMEITTLRNFQIVNGGQTTASLYRAMKMDKSADVSNVFVQMKLTVVSPDRALELVHKISRFSNSQNKISDADFFSNHPFHVRLEGISRRLWAPAREGSLVQTHWFYERARGQFANEQQYLSPARKREFLIQNPKNQVLSKTDIATHFNTFRQLPHEVRRGTQKNFANFAQYIHDRWDTTDGDSQFNETWFQEAVARALAFRATEKVVQEAPWYASWGYRATIVTYSISLLVKKLADLRLCLDLRRIWLNQQVSPAFREQMLILGEIVQTALMDGAVRAGRNNPQEWGKQPKCWDEISRLDFAIVPGLANEVISTEEAAADRREGRRDQRMMTDAEAQIRATELGGQFWAEVYKWADSRAEITPGDLQILALAARIPSRIPNPKQSKRLLEIAGVFEGVSA